MGLQRLLIVNPLCRRNGHDLAPRPAGETVPHALFIVYYKHGLWHVIS